MNKIKKLNFVLFMACIAFVSFGLFMYFYSVNVFAATNKTLDYQDEFGNKEIAEQWHSDGAELVTDYTALSLINFADWGPSINLINYTIENNSVITFEVNFKKGQWLGTVFGLNAYSSRFYTGQSALIMSSVATQGTQLMTQSNGELSSSTMAKYAQFDTLFTTKRVIVKLVIDGDNKISIYKKTVADADFIYMGEYENAFAEGYFGFSGMGNANVDILYFEYYHNGEKVYSDDFTKSQLGFQSTGKKDKDWYAYGAKSANAKLGAFFHVNIGSDGSLTYDQIIKDNKISENIFKASFSFNIERLADGAYAGVAVGMAEKGNLSSGTFIGFGKKDNWYYLACVRNGVEMDVKLSFDESDFVASSGYAKFSCESVCGGKFKVEVLGKTCMFDDVKPDGYFGIGVLAKNIGDCSFNVDDFSFYSFNYHDSSDTDLSINFQGYQETTVTYNNVDYSVKNFYINKYKFYSLGQVSQPMDYENGKGCLKFDTLKGDANYSAFIPKADYSEAIVRFDVRISAVAKDTTEYARFGVGFGLPSEYYSPNYSSYVFFQNQKNHQGEATPTIFGCGNADVGYAGGGCVNFDGKYVSCGYDMWKDTETVYNFMLVSENNSIKVYFKENGEEESKLQILRAEFINANTYGHIAVFGNNGAKFNLLNLSITNVNPYKQQNKGVEGFAKSGEPVNGIVNLNAGESITTQTSYDNSLTFASVKSEQGVKISVGNHSIVLSPYGVTASENVVLTKNELNFDYLASGAYLRVEVLGDKLIVGARCKGSEGELYNPMIEATIISKAKPSAIGFEAVGGVATITDAYSVSFDGKIDIATENYDAETEALNNKIAIKPEKSQDSQNAQGCNAAFKENPVGLCLAAALLIATIVVLMSKKGRVK